jgi:hypothetical protein
MRRTKSEDTTMNDNDGEVGGGRMIDGVVGG